VLTCELNTPVLMISPYSESIFYSETSVVSTGEIVDEMHSIHLIHFIILTAGVCTGRYVTTAKEYMLMTERSVCNTQSMQLSNNDCGRDLHRLQFYISTASVFTI
jgi:hypothetical protein